MPNWSSPLAASCCQVDPAIAGAAMAGPLAKASAERRDDVDAAERLADRDGGGCRDRVARRVGDRHAEGVRPSRGEGGCRIIGTGGSVGREHRCRRRSSVERPGVRQRAAAEAGQRRNGEYRRRSGDRARRGRDDGQRGDALCADVGRRCAGDRRLQAIVERAAGRRGRVGVSGRAGRQGAGEDRPSRAVGGSLDAVSGRNGRVVRPIEDRRAGHRGNGREIRGSRDRRRNCRG